MNNERKHKMPLQGYAVLLCSALSLPFSPLSQAEQNEDKGTEAKSPKEKVETLTIVASPVGNLNLQDESSTASRLGLSALETPATIEIIDGDVMRARGYSKLSDALASLPGVVTGEHPTAPSTFSMRGFSRGQITVLRDGLWIGPSTMVMRPQNTFNLERVEVLRGPASVVNGIGSVAGTVNAITQSAKAGMDDATNVMLGYGSHNTRHLGFGSQGELADDVWYDINLSRYDSSGYVERTDSESNNLTASLLWQTSDDLSFKLSVDKLKDDVGSYFGTPLVPRADARDPLNVITTASDEVLDGAMRYKNYNVNDAVAESEQLFLRLDSQWQINDQMVLNHTIYRFDAERSWQNAEGYVYCTEVVGTCNQYGEIQRYYGYFMLDHDQDVLGNRLTLNIDNDIDLGFGPIESRFVAGIEAIDLDFTRSRGFRRQAPQTPADALDPYLPTPGQYGPRELRGVSPTAMNSVAIFAGNALKLSDNLSLVTGIRREQLDLTRQNFNAQGEPENSGFERDYQWTSWRIGSVYAFSDSFVGYGQYSNAKDPINSNVFLVNNNQDFDLTDAEQFEVGLKASWLDDKAESTFAYYTITRDDIYERFALDSVTNVGGRKSSGFEVSTALMLSEQWRFGANAAYTKAEFQPSANVEQFAGHTPPNVPKWTSNLWTSYDNIADLPLEIGASLHYIDNRYGDNANSVTLKSYTLTNLFAAYKGEGFRVSLRVDNLFNQAYVPWSDVFYLHQNDPGFIYANQLLLGSPRSVNLMFEMQFN